MKFIPIKPFPSQAVTAQLGGQYTQVSLYQKNYGLFADVYLDNVLVIGGVLCLNLNKIVRSDYLGFAGELAFIDTQGTDDPIYTGLGDRFQLAYFEPATLAALQAQAAAQAGAVISPPPGILLEDAFGKIIGAI